MAKPNPEKEKVVIADRAFADTVTARDYKPGDVVTGWDADRIQHYGERGLVHLEDAPTGPGEIAPAVGPSKKK